MSAAPKYDPNNEIFVRREDFDRVFLKAIPKATFHRWVSEGKIKKARDLEGWYLLNKTLVHQGMEPVDVEEFRQERQEVPQGLKNSQLLYIAVLQSDAAFEILSPPRFKLPGTLTPEEVGKIQILKAEHLKVMDLYTERSERIIYRHGFLDALDAAAFVDRE
ncbi:hypothetical protein [Ruficoccus sp. ZRK36]|uniref:hypothetical protein n=1 Tax=Ruficoccus sp. ZRK36 TaxID=2866311 RepID=UPI001C731530|nr:hypothetical protein [Ruficoccus sp. ZRK36]QYY37403.1 hypothetical protein K0V07_07935 [Ruficoccus sp. ZRK36]